MRCCSKGIVIRSQPWNNVFFSEAASSAALPPLRLVRFVSRNVPQRMQVILSGVKTQQGINGKASYKNRRAWIFCSPSTSCPLPQLKLKCIAAGDAGSTVQELMAALKIRLQQGEEEKVLLHQTTDCPDVRPFVCGDLSCRRMKLRHWLPSGVQQLLDILQHNS